MLSPAGGSGVVISRVISPLIWVISISMATLLITLLIATHEPPSGEALLALSRDVARSST